MTSRSLVRSSPRSSSSRHRGVRALVLFMLCAAIGSVAHPQAAPPAAVPATRPAAPPRLVILVVVDQCRRDYLDRFAPQFHGFFRKLHDEGRWFTDGEQHHALTVTAVGHAALGTGRFPCHSGIVGNDFFDPAEGRMVGAANDRTAAAVGGEGGGYSPARLQCDGLGDWWKKQWPAAKTLGISIKPRSAILPLGKSGDGAYWVEDRNGHLVTSAWYRKETAPWVAAFNASDPLAALPQQWDAELGDAAAHAALGCTADDAEGEGDTGAPPSRTFPHRLASPQLAARTQAILYSPYGDELLLAFARAAIEGEALGADDVPDLLVLALSSTDLIGHRHGPDSWEIAEQICHLDRVLGEFMDWAEEKCEGRLLVGLSADHGVCPLPAVATAQGHAGRYVDWTMLQPTVGATLTAIDPKLANAAVPISEYGIRLDPAALTAAGKEGAAVADALAAALRKSPLFADVRSHHELQQPLAADDRAGELLRASSDGVRAGDLLFVLPPYSIYVPPPATAAQMAKFLATSHGTPHDYDTAVPMVFWGDGVAAGRIGGRAFTVDMAPTLARAAGVALPADLDGRPLDLAK